MVQHSRIPRETGKKKRTAVNINAFNMSDDSGPPSKAARFTATPSAKADRRLRSYSCGEFSLPALVPTPSSFVCCRFMAKGNQHDGFNRFETSPSSAELNLYAVNS